MPDYFFSIQYCDDSSFKNEEFNVRRCTMAEAWSQVIEFVENSSEMALYANIKCHNTGEHRRVKM